ncbi:hypothetical protein B0H13DRAFT_1853173 [Mycena leptocephala]|nr:hypothetical protein B0H13DRAFT_1853173 [Mycena leptocephala]
MFTLLAFNPEDSSLPLLLSLGTLTAFKVVSNCESYSHIHRSFVYRTLLDLKTMRMCSGRRVATYLQTTNQAKRNMNVRVAVQVGITVIYGGAHFEWRCSSQFSSIGIRSVVHHRAHGLFPLTQLVAVLLCAGAPVVVLPLEGVLRRLGRVELLGDLGHLDLERANLNVVFALRSSASQPPLRRTLCISELPCQIIVHAREHLEALVRHDAYGRAGSGAVENAAVIVAAFLQSRKSLDVPPEPGTSSRLWRPARHATLVHKAPVCAKVGCASHLAGWRDLHAETRLPTQNARIDETSVCAKVGYALHLVYTRAQDGFPCATRWWHTAASGRNCG